MPKSCFLSRNILIMSNAGGRPKDEHWNHVKAEEDGKWSCRHCGKLFSGKISVTRIKAHLNKEKGQGIAACSSYRHNEGVRNNMASGSSNLQEPVNIVGSIQVAEGVPESIDAVVNSSTIHQNNVNSGEGAPQRIDGPIASGSINPHSESDPIPEGATEGRCTRSDLENEIHHLNQLQSDIKEQLQWMASRGKKRKPEVDKWMEESQKYKKRAVDNNLWDVEIKQLIGEIQKHKEEKPVTLFTEFVGRALDANIKKVFNLLENEQVFVIGIYGMGGVGKTFLVTHVETEVKRKGTFKNVYWVTVSQNFSISRLQHDIAKRMGIKLEEDDDERIRAANLSEALETKEKSILILDDVWKYIDLQRVGIPLKENGIKVILTTRLKHVCQQMDCLPYNNMIRMLPLTGWIGEDEELFKVKLGHNGTPATLPPEVQKIARCIVNRFGGLPLGISMMARTMKGLNDIHRWKHAWNKLKKLEAGEEVQEEVFKVLKRSYDNLMEKNLQDCFLHCALLPGLDRVELIMELVENGLINGRSLEEIFVEGNTILDKLEAHSLLMDYFWTDVCVHRSVTDMACRILKESHRYVMVKFRNEEELTKISHMQEWEDLELVNLLPCNIEEIPEGSSPRCPRLSTLIISGRYQIKHIPDCFIRNMNALTVLNLSRNERLESLPNSLSELRSLVSLVLKGCGSLKDVPPLGELQALSRLDISCCCSIEKVPQGLEKLINLKWLDLSYNENLTMVGFVDVLPNLTSMQYLDLRGCPDVKIKVEDVQGMNMLECFGGTFLNCEHYNHYVEKILDKGFGPKTYCLLLGNFGFDEWDGESDSILPGDPKTKNIFFGDCEDFSHSHILPKDLTYLHIYNNQWICLCEASSLREIIVENCEQLKSVFCLSDPCSLCTLGLVGLPQLKTVFKRLVLQLPNLESITVQDCDSMEEIFAVGNGDDDNGSSIITLPKLITLELVGLPQLKTVCKGNILFGSSPTFKNRNCPNLKCNYPTIPL